MISAARLVANASGVLLDFDGPVTPLMPPPANKEAAEDAWAAMPDAGAEVPPELASSVEWTNLTAAVSDVVAWCNDVASLPREAASGEVHNYVVVAAEALSMEPPVAVDWVLGRIVERLADIHAAAGALPGLFVQHEVPRSTAVEVSNVACVFTSAPRVYIEWLVASDRYAPPESSAA